MYELYKQLALCLTYGLSKTVTPYVIQRCSECDGITHEDRTSGDNVQDDTSFLDVDWARISVTTKSQQVPERYMLDLVRKFKIDETSIPELTLRYKAVKYWSECNKPDGRKSLPNYRKRCSCWRYNVALVGRLFIQPLPEGHALSLASKGSSCGRGDRARPLLDHAVQCSG